MSPIKHPNHNFTFKAPPGMDDCSDLSVYLGEDCIESAWRPTTDEIHAMMQGHEVRVWIQGTQQPVMALGIASAPTKAGSPAIATAIMALEELANEDPSAFRRYAVKALCAVFGRKP